MTIETPINEGSSLAPEGLDLSDVVVPLLKGVLYAEKHPDRWKALLNLQARVRDYIRVIGLELTLDESEGYAFLRSPSMATDDEENQPDPDRADRIADQKGREIQLFAIDAQSKGNS